MTGESSMARERARVQRAQRADLYRPDPELDHLERHPELLDAMSPSDAAMARLQLSYYRRDRSAATSTDEEYDDDAA